MRILLVTQWFDPEPTFKGIAFARELVAQGFEVEVLTGFPNYPGGVLYPGYKMRPLRREIVDGVVVTRVALYPNHGQSGIKRALNYMTFAASSLVYGLCIARRPDLIYAYLPPITVGVSAAVMARIRRVPFVCDVQDLWPDTLAATGMVKSGYALRLVGLACEFVYRSVTHLVVLSPGFKRTLIERGVKPNKVTTIYNWADENSLSYPKGVLHEGFPRDSSIFTVLFAGNVGKAQALDAPLRAMLRLQQRGARAQLVILGKGVDLDRLKVLVATLGISNVIFLPPVPMNEVGSYLAAADALLVHLCRNPLFEITIPSKTQAYMAMGKPLLMAVSGDAAALVRDAQCGLVAAADDPDDIADKIQALQEMPAEARNVMGLRGKQYYQSHLALKIGVSQFGSLFKSIAPK